MCLNHHCVCVCVCVCLDTAANSRPLIVLSVLPFVLHMCVCVCVSCASDHSLCCLYICICAWTLLLTPSFIVVCACVCVCFRPFTVLSVNCVLQTVHCVVCTFVPRHCCLLCHSLLCVRVCVCACVHVCVCVCVCVCVQVVLTPDHSLCCLQRHGKGVMTWPNKTVYVVSSHDI